MSVEKRQITVDVPADSLATLEAEAEKRGVSLPAIVDEAIVEKADTVRRSRRPRLGVGASGGRSAGAAVLTAEPVADDSCR